MKHFTTTLLIALLSPCIAWSGATPEWIWHDVQEDDQKLDFRKEFKVPWDIESAVLAGTCDDKSTVFINGVEVMKNEDWIAVSAVEVAESLKPGQNVVSVRADNRAGAAGLMLRLTIKHKNGKETVIVTDDTWRVSPRSDPEWSKPGFDDASWAVPKVIGVLGGKGLPWNDNISPASLRQAESASFHPILTAQAVSNLNLLPGFKAELVYTVPRNRQGSWVSMANAPDGGLYVSDQGGKGLFHVMPATLGNPKAETIVTPMPADISGAHGLFWAFGGLYAHVSEGNKKGLYKVTDTDGNGDLDSAAYLMEINGSGEHGPHGIIYTEDKQDLYIAAGNATSLPEISGSRAPSNWKEDLLLPRQWDARGHAKGRLAPGGWVCKVSPDGQSWEVVSSGYRNEYDIDMNAEGEVFAYDADMEWDFGTPWYRPTRVCHVVSGSEFGWRSGTGKWPAYFEDSLPPVVNIGPGSPTGVIFGTNAKFPAKYQQALYILDWTFGTIYAIHLTPSGASYTGEKEEFISGAPLAVTDTVIGADGAFYFAVGGRGSQSALYRVYYAGNESTAPPARKESKDTINARALRRGLEAFHGKQHPDAVKTAWPYLGDDDRFLRFAARIAIEAQPVRQWKRRALREKDPQAAAVALIALSRQGDAGLQGDILKALGRFNLAKMDETAALGLLRAYSLCFSRMGRPDQKTIDRVVAGTDPLLPSKSDNLNTELLRLLVYLDAPGIIEKGIALMADARPPVLPDWAELITRNRRYGGTIEKMLANHPPSKKIYYALMLRNIRYGWSMEQRETYFTFINEAAGHTGGASYGGFLANIRDEALANCSDAEKLALAPITGQNLEALPEIEITPPKGPDKPWTLRRAVAAVNKHGLEGRSFENGRNGFYAVGCIACHRFDGAGGGVGPDLSSVSSKFSMADLLEAIIDPNKDISDQYGSSIVTLENGTVVQGIVIDNSGGKEEAELEVYTSDPNADAILIKTADVKTIEESKVSQMAAGLADFLNEDELLDLLAYLVSRGDPEAGVFK